MRVRIDPQDWPISRYGRWETDSKGRYEVPDLLSGSDYSGCLVQRSNHDVWREEFADGEDKWWTAVIGGYCTYAIVVDMESVTDEAKEFLDALDGYCIADDNHHSNMEMQAQSEAWESWARTDFIRALEKRFNVEDLDDAADSQALFELFHDTADRIGEYWENQQGSEMYIRIDRIVAAVKPESFLTVTRTTKEASEQS